MKEIVIVCMVVYGIHYFNELTKREKLAAQDANVNATVRHPTKEFYGATNSATSQNNNFKCDGRVHCSQMNSKSEAIYFINSCPGTKMDGDHDGDPCEQQFH
jgi:hypothetical protein